MPGVGPADEARSATAIRRAGDRRSIIAAMANDDPADSACPDISDGDIYEAMKEILPGAVFIGRRHDHG